MNQLWTAFSFFTIAPLEKPSSMSEVASACYLIPVVAAAVGLFAGAGGWGAEEAFGQAAGAALALCLSLLATGLHHADGLADFGDALMARGGSARRIEVLKDRTLGVGAVGALVMTWLISWAAMLEIFLAVGGAAVILYVVAAELSARMAMLVNAAVSPSSHEGSGNVFLLAARGWRGLAGIVLSLCGLAITMVFLGYAAPLLAAAAGIITAVALSLAGRIWFGGVGGDILGATVELGRMAALLALAAAAMAWPPA